MRLRLMREKVDPGLPKEIFVLVDDPEVGALVEGMNDEGARALKAARGEFVAAHGPTEEGDLPDVREALKRHMVVVEAKDVVVRCGVFELGPNSVKVDGKDLMGVMKATVVVEAHKGPIVTLELVPCLVGDQR